MTLEEKIASKKAAVKKWQAKNRERHAATTKQWQAKNRERHAATTKQWQAKNRERHAATTKQWYEANRERQMAVSKKWRTDNPEKSREIDRKQYKKYREKSPEKRAAAIRRNLYGISDEQFQERLAAQEGKCSICNFPFPGTPHVDHCHTTQKIRGLLCGSCNKALGFLKDDFSIAIRAADYLRKNATSPA